MQWNHHISDVLNRHEQQRERTTHPVTDNQYRIIKDARALEECLGHWVSRWAGSNSQHANASLIHCIKSCTAFGPWQSDLRVPHHMDNVDGILPMLPLSVKGQDVKRQSVGDLSVTMILVKGHGIKSQGISTAMNWDGIWTNDNIVDCSPCWLKDLNST